MMRGRSWLCPTLHLGCPGRASRNLAGSRSEPQATTISTSTEHSQPTRVSMSRPSIHASSRRCALDAVVPIADPVHGPDQLRILGIALDLLPQLGDVPVSYTHLRAHETPEHLVCRLLLEKKK